jgi:hypothetical protein
LVPELPEDVPAPLLDCPELLLEWPDVLDAPLLLVLALPAVLESELKEDGAPLLDSSRPEAAKPFGMVAAGGGASTAPVAVCCAFGARLSAT